MILAPSSSFVPIVTEVAADRRMYLPLAAIVAAVVCVVAWGVQRLVKPAPCNAPPRLIASAAVIVVLLSAALAWGTVNEVHDYRSRVSVWQDVLAMYPKTHTAHNNLGAIYFDLHDYEKSRYHFEQALKDKPKSLITRINLANVYLHQGDDQTAEQMLRDVIEKSPDNAAAKVNLRVS